MTEMADHQPHTDAAEQPAAPQQQDQNRVDITLNDLAGLKAIIDLATQRGTFKASEFEAVGRLYTKLSKFLEQVSKQEGQ